MNSHIIEQLRKIKILDYLLSPSLSTTQTAHLHEQQKFHSSPDDMTHSRSTSALAKTKGHLLEN